MDALEVVVGVLLKEVAVVVVAVGVDLLDESVFLAHLHLHSDPFAWQAPCIHNAVVEAAGLEADLELVVDAAEADGLEAGLELVVALAVWDVVEQEAIFEVVAAKKVGVRVVEVLALGPVDDVGLSLVDILKAASVLEPEVLERAGVQGAELLELELLELADEGVVEPGDVDAVVEGAVDQNAVVFFEV